MKGNPGYTGEQVTSIPFEEEQLLKPGPKTFDVIALLKGSQNQRQVDANKNGFLPVLARPPDEDKQLLYSYTYNAPPKEEYNLNMNNAKLNKSSK
jgi:hypothetical protein